MVEKHEAYINSIKLTGGIYLIPIYIAIIINNIINKIFKYERGGI